jgi:C1A family cysteine protease
VLCSEDIGASPGATQVYYGDQARNSCTTANPFGILNNLTWTNEDLLTCVKDQGNRGTCHIFASTSAMEKLIARDTGNRVNLSEQDFMENEKLTSGPAFWGDGGDSKTDLDHAQGAHYNFAYENQWDYNPSFDRTGKGGQRLMP